MTAADLEGFLQHCGVDDVGPFVEQAVVPLTQGPEAAAPNPRSQGLRMFDGLIGRETDRLVDLVTPAVTLRERDYFAERGGGWLAGS